MAVRTPEHSELPDTRSALGRGMEQFHHPRPVCIGHGSDFHPTPQRERLTAGLTGRVLEIGAGDGVKLGCFPSGLDEIVLIEPDPFLREVARTPAAEISTPVRILDGDLMTLPVANASCDAVVCSLVLCCVPRPEATLSEVRRVLRPGGELRFYEHQRSGNSVVALIETMATPLWARACGGCHPARDTVAAIERAGFGIERLDRLSFDHVSHVLGVARPR
ncbi:class I SAM-dependent methyltransferase [Streptosporangium lutulentum]|uniref:SAM-dependent methyltransferase n=1 Tax=Streptosporangium lutulentum TaxID=1461250 RepID=A0ABT9QKX2_9ACTN|nr:class I SAM-dependent methyltransferase [Streptosporangium lutulentum]MDP9847407.1 SAM-dependent methyltransferase [Streptosporangium lutulentum]